ncbi:MAG: SDR family oxidoreductase, partial [Bacteroidota bacterium]
MPRTDLAPTPLHQPLRLSMGRTVFVTGGTGFVGSHLVEELLGRGADEVRCLVRSRAKWLDGLPVRHIRGGLHDLGA